MAPPPPTRLDPTIGRHPRKRSPSDCTPRRTSSTRVPSRSVSDEVAIASTVVSKSGKYISVLSVPGTLPTPPTATNWAPGAHPPTNTQSRPSPSRTMTPMPIPSSRTSKRLAARSESSAPTPRQRPRCDGAAGLDPPDVGAGEPERLEQPRAQRRPDIDAGDRCDHFPEQDRVDVAVAHRGPWLEQQRTVSDDGQDVSRRERSIEVGEDQRLELVEVRQRRRAFRALRRQAGGVRQQLADRERLGRREVRHVPGDRIVEDELAFIDQIEDQRADERLGDAGDRERRLDRERET